MPSVAMSDGTFRKVVTAPLTRPTMNPPSSRARMTHQVALGSLLARMAPMMTVEVTTEPTERSKPPETSTNTCPAVRIISGVARCRKVRKLSGWKKTGLRMPTQTSSARAMR